MRLARPRDTTSLLMWVGLLGAPFAWTLQHVAGVQLTIASCREPGSAQWHIPLDAWTIVVSAGAVVLTLAGLVAAILAYRRTNTGDDKPPVARIHFLSIVALTTTPLFLAIMLMSGFGAIFLTCRQS